MFTQGSEACSLPLGSKPYRGRIHMWDHPKGNYYTREPSPAQGLTSGNARVLDLASGAPPHLTAEGAGAELRSNKAHVSGP